MHLIWHLFLAYGMPIPIGPITQGCGTTEGFTVPLLRQRRPLWGPHDQRTNRQLTAQQAIGCGWWVESWLSRSNHADSGKNRLKELFSGESVSFYRPVPVEAKVELGAIA